MVSEKRKMARHRHKMVKILHRVAIVASYACSIHDKDNEYYVLCCSLLSNNVLKHVASLYPDRVDPVLYEHVLSEISNREVLGATQLKISPGMWKIHKKKVRKRRRALGTKF